MEDIENVLKESVQFYREQEKIITSRLATLPRGSIKKKKIKGKTYYYLQYRKGKKVITEYIGRKVPERLKEELRERKQLEEELKKIRSALKRLGEREKEIDLVEPVKNLLKEFTRHKLWDYGVSIAGTWCFILYQKYLPVDAYPLRTQDVDFVVPLPYRGPKINLANILRELGFEERFNPDGSVHFRTGEIKVEFISPKKGRGRTRPPYIEKLNITPQSLRFVDLLLMQPVIIKISRGVKASVPSPASFALHKLLISTVWMRQDKKEKDIKQAIYLLRYILYSEEEKERLLSLYSQIPQGWKKKIIRALNEAEKLLPLEKPTISAVKEILGI